MLGGTMRAPLTGAIFALELTGDLTMLPALLTASTAAFAVTVLLLKRSILTEKIARRGQHISREYGVDPYELTRVGDVMVKSLDVLSADLPISDAVAVIAKGAHRVYPVVDAADRPVGLVTRADALLWKIEGGHEGERIGERVSDADLPVAYSDQVVARAIDTMLARDQGRLPVVDRRSGALVGLLSRKDLLQMRAATAATENTRRAYFGGRARRFTPG